MKETRTGSNRPVHYHSPLPIRLQTQVLLRDWDEIEKAEDQASDWIRRGHSYTVDIPRET